MRSILATILLSFFLCSTAMAEIYRYPGDFYHDLAAKHGHVSVTDGVLSIDIDPIIDRIDEFDVKVSSSRDLVFPDSIVGVYAIKPMGGAILDTMMVTFVHRGDGVYAQMDPYASNDWNREIDKDFQRGYLVLERFDGLHSQLAELNEGTIALNIRMRFAGEPLESKQPTTRERQRQIDEHIARLEADGTLAMMREAREEREAARERNQ